MPFTLRTEGFRDNPRRFAFMNGPLVLAAKVAPGKPFPAIVAEESSSWQAFGRSTASPRPSRGRPTSSACRARTRA